MEDANYAGPALRQRKTLLNDILSEFRSDLSAKDRVMMQFELAKIYFNELPSDALHSYFQVPAERFAKEHKPQLLLAYRGGNCSAAAVAKVLKNLEEQGAIVPYLFLDLKARKKQVYLIHPEI